MKKIEVGYEVEICNFDGRYKILEIQCEKIKIQFGCCIMNIRESDIIKIYVKKKTFFPSCHNSPKYYDFLDFNTTLDLHGKNVADSLEILEEWLNQGIKLGHRYFRIIHGKGNGILRNSIKKFLSKKKLSEFSHESDLGGSTILEF
ncbi:MAG: Smr/MutS family protein [Cytophagales bacterium]|jgi:DNA mismatch repair protein MutS2|nr:Smr/MutS family protein [Cytophagales bacterium]